ncbi:helix-turn-helix transcriptional regulator [Lentzea albida]|uniref:PAS fold-containing protein n=1 Tax=Lentzea albida TaxID=65499 RepID=A0A1H9WT12_9PSEU|nr:LuxR C-terminal-related transcriptional regulator [Lentzea albida]SES37082.1 PAS fold-containing protein [Lentzea albida]
MPGPSVLLDHALRDASDSVQAITTTTGVLVAVSASFSDLVGRPGRALLGRSWYEFLSTRDAARDRACARRLARSGEVGRFSVEISRPSCGSVLPAEITLVRVWAEARRTTWHVRSVRGRPVRPAVREVSAVRRRIVEMIASGRTNQQIAGALGVSRQAVEYHVTRLLRSTGTSDRAHLTSFAYHHGWLKTADWPPVTA